MSCNNTTLTIEPSNRDLLTNLINTGSYVCLVFILALIVVIKFMNRRKLNQKNENNVI